LINNTYLFTCCNWW